MPKDHHIFISDALTKGRTLAEGWASEFAIMERLSLLLPKNCLTKHRRIL